MATFIEMPKLSDTMTEGTLLKWLKKEGDKVEAGDILAEIETDKATMEMEAFDDGTIGKIYVSEGEKVPIGEKLAVLVEEGEDPPEKSPGKQKDKDPQKKDKAGKEAKEEEETDEDEEKDGTGEEDKPDKPEKRGGPKKKDKAEKPENRGRSEEGGSSRVKASPLARKVAEEKGVELDRVEGTGPGGRIVKKDVLAAAEGGTKAKGKGARPSTASPTVRAAAGEGDEKVPLSGMRAAIAERLLASKTQIPHFYLHTEVDAAPFMAMRKQLNQPAEKDGSANKYTITDFVLRAVVAAVRDVPAANSSFAGDHLIRFGSVHLAVAVAVEDGLVTPVIRDAGSRSLLDLSATVKDLASRARNKKLKPDEMQGGTITVSTLGGYGVTSFDAIINPPQAVIVSVGAIVEKPVVVGGAVVSGQRMDLGLSCDHRVVDGAVGATYLAAVKNYLEKPALMFV